MQVDTKLTDETIDKKEASFKEMSFDYSGKSKRGPEHLSGPTVDKFYAEDRQALRKWFEKNHSTSTGAWMIYDKKVSEKRTLAYDDVVEEAISFGWIDSLTRSLNDRQAMYYLSPRKAKSPWSKLNIKAQIALMSKQLKAKDD